MKRLLASIFLLSFLNFAQNSPQPQPQIGYKSASDAEQKKTVLLRDSKPVSMLHVPVYKIDKAKFYVIDVRMEETTVNVLAHDHFALSRGKPSAFN
jgi:hypothetical protein